jgi:DNA-binding response OmpR family regulator
MVDDDSFTRKLVALVLGRVGYRVDCADDGEAGWDALCADRFDLMITDQDMPRLTGLDLLRRMRTSLIRLPVILASGRIPWHEPDLLRLLPPGLALAKPFLPVDLLTKVRRFLTPTAGAAKTDPGQTGLHSIRGGALPRIA